MRWPATAGWLAVAIDRSIDGEWLKTLTWSGLEDKAVIFCWSLSVPDASHIPNYDD